MKVGVDYYPEHWPRKRWEKDAQMMKEAKFDVARLAEFAWTKMEPQKGEFNFEWLEDAIEVLSGHDIEVVLGTPTASPPAWIIDENPDILPVAEKGVTETFGGRRHYCPNNPDYREHSKRITKAMAERFGKNPNVIGWQVDNEFHGRCYCEDCRKAFHDWLKEKYGSLDELNEEWGTVFWSHTYGSWEEIPTPRSTARAHNPGLELDYYRFSSDSWFDYQQLQIDVLNSELDGEWITHNFMLGGFEGINYSKLAKNLDFISWDNYPKYSGEANSSFTAAANDLARGINGTGYWLMEQQSGPTGWDKVARAPEPGQLRLWSYQSLARGADTIVFFRWRTCRFGTEQYWHGILDHHGEKGRRYDEIKKFSEEVHEFGEDITPEEVEADAAILKDYETHWAFEIQHNSPSLDYGKEIRKYHKNLFDLNVTADIITPRENFLESNYELLIAPNLYLVSEDLSERLHGFVEDGGTLVLSYRSGVKEARNNKVVNQKLPGKLKDLVGAEVEEYTSLPAISEDEAKTESNRGPAVEFTSSDLAPLSGEIGVWADSLELKSAEPLALYRNFFYKDRPAVTLNEYGDGWVVYVGTSLSSDLQLNLSRWITKEKSISRIEGVPSGIEATWRGNKEVLYLMNHENNKTQFELDQNFTEVKSGEKTKKIELSPYGVKVLIPSD